MNPPKISVIVPVYNAGTYLSRCVESILDQTETSLELILVDDGSTDGSGELCQSYAGKDARIRVIRQENRGVSAARNAGLEIARGTWIAFCDGDDRVESTMYETLLAVQAQTGGDVIFCGFSREYSDHTQPETFPERKTLEKADVPHYVEQLMTGRYFGAVWRGLYANHVISRCRFDEDVRYAEDLVFLMELLKHVNRMTLTPEILYYYNKANENSVCARTEHDPDFRYRRSLQKQLVLNEYWQIPLDPNVFYMVYVDMMFQHLVRLLEAGGSREQVETYLAEPFFAGCCIYDRNIPLRRRVICRLIRHRRFRLAVAVRRLEDVVLRLLGR